MMILMQNAELIRRWTQVLSLTSGVPKVSSGSVCEVWCQFESSVLLSLCQLLIPPIQGDVLRH